MSTQTQAQSTYSYKARDASGTVVSGSMVAASADEVSNRLRAEGKYVVAIDSSALSAKAELDVEQIRRNEAAKRVNRDDVIALCQQLGVMLETGVPLADALNSFCKQVKHVEFQKVLRILCDDIYGGEPISVAMARWPRVFPTMIVSLMKASEASGTLGMMFGRIGEYLGKERRTAKQIKGAMAYPIFMMVCGLGMTVFLLAFVLPRFTAIYSQRAATLPAPTRILMGFSDFLTSQYFFYGPAIAIIVIGLVVFGTTMKGRRTFDWLKLNVPVLRTMYRQLYITRAARTMATLFSAGINALDVIDICRGVTLNLYFQDLWNTMEHDVRDGKQLSEPMLDSTVIPPSVGSMVAAGEKSGRLSEVMEKIADFAEQELDNAVKKTTTFIEPIMILFMGFVVGGVAVALLLPIFSLGKTIGGG